MNLNLLVSIIIYALMAFFVGCGFYHIVNLSKYQKDFALIGKRIKTDAQAVIDLQEYLEGTTSEQNKLFQSDKLNAKLEEYRAAYQRTKSTSFAAPFVDITDFFNGEFLDELGHTGFCELVPGTMTGLGILGTFVGLVLGVGGFDTSTTDAVMVSITHLLGGMSTAFLTSIVGVLLSLAFSHIYKKYVDSTNQSLEDFVTAFHDKNLDGSSSNAENQLLGYQQQQTELMKNFATVVSEAVSTSIANTMRTELVPIFDEMKSTVKEFSEIASQQQKDGLNQVVQEFIRCMNESLRGQFDELAATIQKTCEWQKASTEQMQKIVDSICDTSNEIEKVNAVSHQTVEEMNGFVTLLKEYQEKLHSEAELIQQQIANSNEISERQANYLDKLVESESRVADLADNVKKEADAAQQAELEEKEQIILNQQSQIDTIVGVRGDLIDALSKEFSGNDLSVKVDAQSGAITFDSTLLFGYNDDKLQDSGKAFLAEFLPKYFSVLLGKDFSPYVAEIIIEGHTDTDGGYMYNLQLSQNRAFAVVSYCLDENNHFLSDSQLEELRVLLTANGRSWSAPIYAADGTVDMQASRRVEIKFRLKDEEMMNQIAEMLEETK